MTTFGSEKYKVRGRIWIEINDNAFIGEGKAILLEKTAELGSLRKAATALDISYRKAWYSLNQMNKTADTPLITLKHGGKHGGIAEISEFGKEILEKFKHLKKEFAVFTGEQTKTLNK